LKKVTVLMLIPFLLVTSISLFASQEVYANSPSLVQVETIDHLVTPIYGGLIIINDTIKISPTVQNATIENFLIGFPSEYGPNLRLALAYTAENFSEKLDTISDTGLGVIGYYGITVVFPDEVRDLLYNGQSYTFTVTFVFSKLIESYTRTVNETTEYTSTADFPVYPSLVQEASTCNVRVILPKNTGFRASDVSFPFNATQKDYVYYLNYTKSPLPKLTKESTQVTFISANKETYACFSVSKLSREIIIDANGRISASEIYLLKSETAFTVDKIRLSLPKNISDVSAFDEIGSKLIANFLVNETYAYEISLQLAKNQSRSLRLNYKLEENNLVQQDPQSYVLTLDLSENLRVIPASFTLKIIFPEGAAIQSFPQQKFGIHRDVFLETLSVSLSDINWLQNERWSVVYSYSVFWVAFRPTLWALAIVIIGSVIAFAWRRPKAPMVVSVVLVPRKTLNEFVESYEEKKRIVSELEQILGRARKGKISRRRYKVRKTTLENRLSVLSRRLTELRQRVMSGGAKYADIMRQLEVAETELDNIEADIKRIEVRFKRGEISAQTYRRLLEDDLRRREKARTTIDGVLLRLRE